MPGDGGLRGVLWRRPGRLRRAGRVAHESVFNTNDGRYRCPSSQQGYSPFSTWTRGLAWIMTGYAEELQYLATVDDKDLAPLGGRAEVEAVFLKAARASCDFYIDHAAAEDGIPYWDTGAPGLVSLGDWKLRPADPFNLHEPVDSSAAAIACQGLIRLGEWLAERGDEGAGRYRQAGLSTLRTLLTDRYLSRGDHQGLLIHSVYHRPRGWDYVPPGQKVPCGESSQWGDYHLREAALQVQRIAEGKPAYRFDGQPERTRLQKKNSPRVATRGLFCLPANPSIRVVRDVEVDRRDFRVIGGHRHGQG